MTNVQRAKLFIAVAVISKRYLPQQVITIISTTLNTAKMSVLETYVAVSFLSLQIRVCSISQEADSHESALLPLFDTSAIQLHVRCFSSTIPLYTSHSSYRI